MFHNGTKPRCGREPTDIDEKPKAGTEMTILVTGATGNVGRHVVEQLLHAGQRVRALTRDPSKASLPDGVEVSAGDLATPQTLAPALDGVDALHLIAFSGEGFAPLQTAPEILELAVEAGVRRATVLTGTDDELAVLKAVQAAEVEWTHLRPPEFMANALGWAHSIRTDGEVRAAFGSQLHAVVHEADIAAVAVTALLEDGHVGRTYSPTGPEALTVPQQAGMIAAAIGRHVRFVELTPDQAREQMRAMKVADDVIEAVIDYGVNPPEEAHTVLATVEQVTGRTPRSFTQWATEHAAAFR